MKKYIIILHHFTIDNQTISFILILLSVFRRTNRENKDILYFLNIQTFSHFFSCFLFLIQ